MKLRSFNIQGFTLIELILSSVILAIIGIYTWMSMDASFRTQRTMQRYSYLQEIGHGVAGKMAMDIGQAFHVVQTPAYTFFRAKGDELEFTSLGHTTLSPDARESELTEITYKTQTNTQGQGLMLLQRRETSYIDGPIENAEDAPFYTLTDLLSEMKWEFSLDGSKFLSTWDTTSSENRDQLPKLVRLSFTLKENKENLARRDEPREAEFTSLMDIPLSLLALPTKSAQGKENQASQGTQPPQQPRDQL